MSVINYRDLNGEHRYDAEYFAKRKLQMIEKLQRAKHCMIGDFSEVTDGIHTSIDYDGSSNVNLISATSPRENYFDLSRNARISEKAHRENPRTALRERDVILSTVGTIGNCAVVDEKILPANSDRHVGIIRIKDRYSPYVVSSYLLSKYGRMQTQRETTGNVQPNLFLYKIKEILIPEFGETLQKQVEKICISALKKRGSAEAKYREAEQMLCNELGTINWKPRAEKKSVRNFREVLEAGRMDAEYYQLEYTDIAEKLRQYSYESLNTACRICDANFTPDPKTEYKYIELANIGNEGQINGCTRAYGKDLPGRARRIVHCGDIIVSSIEGSLQSCALVPEEYNGALCSTGFFVIHSEKINPETLLVLMKSWPIQALLKQSCSGTILTAFGKADLENIPLPVIREDIQKKIAQLIKESFRLREESGSMTNAAKKALETAIEQGEAEALKILEELG